MDRFTAIKKKKKYKTVNIFFEIQTSISRNHGRKHGETHGRGWEEGEIYGALMRILPKDRSPAIMIHGFDVQRIADAPCYVIVSQLTTRIP